MPGLAFEMAVSVRKDARLPEMRTLGSRGERHKRRDQHTVRLALRLSGITRNDTSVGDILALERHVGLLPSTAAVRDVPRIGKFPLLDHLQGAARGIGGMVGKDAFELGAAGKGNSHPLALGKQLVGGKDNCHGKSRTEKSASCERFYKVQSSKSVGRIMV